MQCPNCGELKHTGDCVIKPDCYKFQHHDIVPGDAHSRCRHPDICDTDPLAKIFAIFGSVGRDLMIALYLCIAIAIFLWIVPWRLHRYKSIK